MAPTRAISIQYEKQYLGTGEPNCESAVSKYGCSFRKEFANVQRLGCSHINQVTLTLNLLI